MNVRHGTNHLLEEKATALILASLDGVTNREHKADIMTPWKERDRKRKEILTTSGAQVDPSVRRGQYSKAYNPDKPQLNSRDCPTRPMRMSSSWDPEEGVVTGYLSSEMAAVFGVERIDS